jgi:hypothetical protein
MIQAILVPQSCPFISLIESQTENIKTGVGMQGTFL